MILIFQAAKCTIFNIIENVFSSIVGLIFFNIGSSGLVAVAIAAIRIVVHLPMAVGRSSPVAGALAGGRWPLKHVHFS